MSTYGPRLKGAEKGRRICPSNQAAAASSRIDAIAGIILLQCSVCAVGRT